MACNLFHAMDYVRKDDVIIPVYMKFKEDRDVAEVEKLLSEFMADRTTITVVTTTYPPKTGFPHQSQDFPELLMKRTEDGAKLYDTGMALADGLITLSYVILTPLMMGPKMWALYFIPYPDMLNCAEIPVVHQHSLESLCRLKSSSRRSRK